jgi:hypothetical protein
MVITKGSKFQQSVIVSVSLVGLISNAKVCRNLNINKNLLHFIFLMLTCNTVQLNEPPSFNISLTPRSLILLHPRRQTPPAQSCQKDVSNHYYCQVCLNTRYSAYYSLLLTLESLHKKEQQVSNYCNSWITSQKKRNKSVIIIGSAFTWRCLLHPQSTDTSYKREPFSKVISKLTLLPPYPVTIYCPTCIHILPLTFHLQRHTWLIPPNLTLS